MTSVRFVHTSDWQLGMTRHFLDADAQARYTGARIDVVRTIGEVARERDCDFVVVAGDVLESSLVSSQTIRRSLAAMGSIGCPVYLLPGNHDSLDAVSVYSAPVFRDECPDNVHVLAEPGVTQVAPGVQIVAAPLFARHPITDLVAEQLTDLAPADDLRILVGHGAVDVIDPDSRNLASLSLSAMERAIADGLIHYVALGDRHSRLSVGETGRVHYSGAPEVTSFREEFPGDVLVVDLDEQHCTVEPVHVGTWNFVSLIRQVEGDEDLDALDAELEALDPKDRTVVRTALTGTLTLAQKARLDAMLTRHGDALAGRFTWERHEDIAVVVGDDLDDLGIGGFVGSAAAELAQIARSDTPAAGPPDVGGTDPDDGTDGADDVSDPAASGAADDARGALSLLYRLAKGATR